MSRAFSEGIECCARSSLRERQLHHGMQPGAIFRHGLQAQRTSVKPHHVAHNREPQTQPLLLLPLTAKLTEGGDARPLDGGHAGPLVRHFETIQTIHHRAGHPDLRTLR